jgi:hypothetical protein
MAQSTKPSRAASIAHAAASPSRVHVTYRRNPDDVVREVINEVEAAVQHFALDMKDVPVEETSYKTMFVP